MDKRKAPFFRGSGLESTDELLKKQEAVSHCNSGHGRAVGNGLKVKQVRSLLPAISRCTRFKHTETRFKCVLY
jgi:hypothetical protein